MQERFAKKLRWIYGICLSVFTVFLGALFISRVWAVYKCGVTPAFTRARVQAYFEILILPFWLWVLAVIGGEIVFTLFPKEKNRVKGYADVAASLNRLKGKLPQHAGGRYELNKKSNLRFIVGCIAKMPYFGEFAAKYPEVQVVAISRAESRAYEDVCRWLNGNASVRAWASYPITFCYDKQDDGASKGLYYDLGFSGAMPTTFIVGADGKIKDKISYEMHSLEDVENLVLQYL